MPQAAADCLWAAVGLAWLRRLAADCLWAVGCRLGRGRDLDFAAACRLAVHRGLALTAAGVGVPVPAAAIRASAAAVVVGKIALPGEAVVVTPPAAGMPGRARAQQAAAATGCAGKSSRSSRPVGRSSVFRWLCRGGCATQPERRARPLRERQTKPHRQQANKMLQKSGRNRHPQNRPARRAACRLRSCSCSGI